MGERQDIGEPHRSAGGAIACDEMPERIAVVDEETYRDAGQGGFEIRTLIAAAAAANGAKGQVWFYAPIPAFACGCPIGVMNLTV